MPTLTKSRALLAASIMVLFAGSTLLTESRAADSSDLAQQGLETLLEKPLSFRVMTVDELESLWLTWEPAERELAEAAPVDERRRLTFERYGLIERNFDGAKGAMSSLPLGYTADQDGNLYPNCFACHGGKVAGRVIPGINNSHQDLTALVGDLAALRALRADPPRDPEQARKGASLGFPLNFVKGSTNATQYSILLGAMRDRDLELTLPKLSQAFVHNSIDAPAWWLFKRKSRIYWDGMAPKTTRTLMQFTMAPGLAGSKIRSWEEDFELIRAYIESLEPPEFPFEIDAELAENGRRAFERVCAECHGTYASDASSESTYPERTVPLSLVGTDPLRLMAITPEAKNKYNDSWFSNYGEHPVLIDVDGYVAPPLDGVWATAPYLHNGSVPTLWHVLHPDQRPTVWRRSEDGYDVGRVGLEVEVLDQVPSGVNERTARTYYDTSVTSHDGSGHRFPDQLTPDERTAVLEYLKTL